MLAFRKILRTYPYYMNDPLLDLQIEFSFHIMNQIFQIAPWSYEHYR